MFKKAGVLILCLWVALAAFAAGQRFAPEPVQTGDTISAADYQALANTLDEANRRADTWRGRFQALADAPEQEPAIVKVPVIVPDTVYAFVSVERDIATVSELVPVDTAQAVATARVRTVDISRCPDWYIYAGRIVCDRQAFGDWALYLTAGVAYDDRGQAVGEAGATWKPYRNSRWEARVGVTESAQVSATVTRYFGR